jgi:HlyD family secretion protein
VTRGQPIARLDARTFEAKVREERAAVAVAQATVLIEEAAVEKAAATLANTKALQVVLEAETAAARATFVEAERNLERKERLAKKSGAVAQTDLDAAVARRDATRAGVRAAQARVKAHVTSIETVAAAQRMASAKLENARAQVTERQAELEQAEVELARTTIRAPIDGVVIGRNVDLSQTVAASLEAPTVFTIAQDLSDMEVHASTDEADIGSVRVGQPVSFTVDAHPNRRFAGEVIQIRKAPRYLENVVVYTVVISAANPELLLLPGMTATARIVVNQVSGVLKVLGAALRFDPPEDAALAASPKDGDQDLPDWVWVLDDDGLPSAVRVSLGARNAVQTMGAKQWGAKQWGQGAKQWGHSYLNNNKINSNSQLSIIKT